MRIAALERFPEPSRRCDPALIGGSDDDIVVWEAHAGADAASRGQTLPRTALSWMMLPLSPRARWRLLRACLRVPAGRRAALTGAPTWVRALRGGEIDELVWFSSYDFDLASSLAGLTGTPHHEFLARGTQYFGEFAFELLAVVPYAHWLHRQGQLDVTVSSPDTACLYYFSPRHIERSVRRKYVPITEYPVGQRGRAAFDVSGFPRSLDTTKWAPPPYRDVYGHDARFRWPKPPVVLCNKASDERYLGRGFAVNVLEPPLLIELIGRLNERYTVIYNRPRSSDIVDDHAEIRDVGDIEAVKQAFPDVLTIQEIHARHPGMTFNELQLRIFAGCERFVSVVGGAAYLASYFGGTNVVYARAGWEVDCGGFDGWFHHFSGARVTATSSPRSLLGAVERALLG